MHALLFIFTKNYAGQSINNNILDGIRVALDAGLLKNVLFLEESISRVWKNNGSYEFTTGHVYIPIGCEIHSESLPFRGKKRVSNVRYCRK